MSGLFAWVKELVGLILFAALTELLLPEGSLRKYARFALSLVVLTALIGPIASALHRPWAADEDLLRRIDEILSPPKGASSAARPPSGVADGDGRFSREVFRESEGRIAQAIASQLASAGLPVERVNARLEGSLAQPRVAEVVVYFTEGPRTARKDEPGHVSVTVPPIVVSQVVLAPERKVATEPGSLAASSTGAPPSRRNETPEHREVEDKARRLLAERFGLPSEVVHVVFAPAKE
ncbi:stage III sporulation protein AF [Brockia lithotrophica]|uniref:Stage III sporulation protein AF n=1 Tax=Brockia lithotrophica TaxID=933949 RepID=A0A660L9W8_9BACL|nr:stage III sporulation protein AF [Brockia lithotrophica]RKQ88743.1 stage III sporulation protein AF [Brockia lithotrophica]